MNDMERKIKVLILAGGRDFGRCPVATEMPYAFWPVADKTILENLVGQIKKQGINEVEIYFNDEEKIIQPLLSDFELNGVNVNYDTFALGSGGCLKHCLKKRKCDLLIVMDVKIFYLPDLSYLIEKALNSSNPMSIGVFKSEVSEDYIYLCKPSVMDFIKTDGYYDIKEEVIREITGEGKNIDLFFSIEGMPSFKDRKSYLDSYVKYFSRFPQKAGFQKLGDDVYAAKDCKISSSCKLLGPLFIGEKVEIGEDSVISGPAVIGNDCIIEHGVLLKNSQIWDKSRIGAESELTDALIDTNVNLFNRSVVADTAISNKRSGFLRKLKSGSNRNVKVRPKECVPVTVEGRLKNRKPLMGLAGLMAGGIFYSFWPQIKNLWEFWNKSDEYSIGMLVPIVALYVIWNKRKYLLNTKIRPAISGLLLLIFSQAVRYFGTYFMYGSLERYSILLSFMGLVLCIFGWEFFKKLLPLFAFMFLMFPLPRSLHNSILIPLQNIATDSSVFLLQLCSLEAWSEGNIINISGRTVAVVEACNGLRMVMSFFVITGLVVLIVNKSKFEKMLLILSSIPIALLCNTLRLSFTSAALVYLEGPDWEALFHDFGGYLMMPVAFLLVIAELKVFDKIIIDENKGISGKIIVNSV